MKRRRSIKSLEVLAEHPPQQCRKFMSSGVLKILDDIARDNANKPQQFNREERAQ
jgi:hypothetical protein